jgi:hypothetical protein
MADWDDDDNFEDGTELVKQLRKQLKEKTAALKEREERLAELEPQVRANSLTSILSELNVKDPRVARLMPKEIDVTKENVESWLGEYGDLFNIKTGETEGAESASATTDTTNTGSTEQQDWQRFQAQSQAAGAAAPDTESNQIAMLQRANEASGGNVDKYFAMLRGEIPIPN